MSVIAVLAVGFSLNITLPPPQEEIDGVTVQTFTTVDDGVGAVVYDLNELNNIDLGTVPIPLPSPDETVRAVTTADDESGAVIIDLSAIPETTAIPDQEFETVSTIDDEPGAVIVDMSIIPSSPPPPLFAFEDTFTGTAGTLAGRLSDSSAIWVKHPTTDADVETLVSGDGTIYQPTALKTSLYYSNFTPTNGNYYVEGDFFIKSTPTAPSIGITGRSDPQVQTYYGVRYNGTALLLFVSVSGTLTTLGTHTVTLALNQVHTVRLIMNGTQLSVMLNGSIVLGPITNTTIPATNVGRVGTRIYVASTTNLTAADGAHLSAVRANQV